MYIKRIARVVIASLFCFLFFSSNVHAENKDVDISSELERIKEDLKTSETPEKEKTQLIELYNTAAVTGEEEYNTDICEVLNLAQEKITDNRQQYINDNWLLIPFLKAYIRKTPPLYSFREINTKSEYKKNARALRRKLIELIGGLPEKVALSSSVLSRTTHEDYVEEKVIFQSELHRFVVATVLVPKKQKEKHPAVICLHEHAGQYFKGKDGPTGNIFSDSELTYARDLAEQGYLTITIDAPCFGERYEDEGKVDLLGKILGRPLFTFVLYDDLRSIDYLVSRTDVDKDNITCIGHSMGGTRAIYLTAIDERIKAGVSMNGFANMRDLIEQDMYEWPPTCYMERLARIAETEDIVSLIAPRPFLLVIAKYDDSIPVQQSIDAVAYIKKMYKINNCEDKFKFILFDTGHNFNSVYHKRIYNWLSNR